MLCFLPSVYGLSTRCPELYVLGYSTGTCVYVFCPMLYVLTGVVLVDGSMHGPLLGEVFISNTQFDFRSLIETSVNYG